MSPTNNTFKHTMLMVVTKEKPFFLVNNLWVFVILITHMNHMKPSPSIKKPHHYINMHPNSLYVSLDFGQIYHCKSGQSPSKKRLVATDN
jgi:hypothetical protein